MVTVTQKLRKVQRSQKKSQFEMGTDDYPKINLIVDPGVTPATRVFHPDLGVGHNRE